MGLGNWLVNDRIMYSSMMVPEIAIFETANWSMIEVLTGFPTFANSAWVGGIDTTPDDFTCSQH